MEQSKPLWPIGLVFALVVLAGIAVAFWRVRREGKQIGAWGWSVAVMVLLVTIGFNLAIGVKEDWSPYVAGFLIVAAGIIAIVTWIYSGWLAEGISKSVIWTRLLAGGLILLVLTGSTVAVGWLFYVVAEKSTPLTIAMMGGIVWFVAIIFVGMLVLDIATKDEEEEDSSELSNIEDARKKKEESAH